MAKNSNLHAAKKNANDEFYTQLTDIEKELKHYKHHFKDKVVFCNCDDVRSEFLNHFIMDYYHYSLKKIIATHYDEGKNPSRRHSYKVEIVDPQPIPNTIQDLNGDGKADYKDLLTYFENELFNPSKYNPDSYVPRSISKYGITMTVLKTDGDFRSPESIELLKESDIVVTNPPFSLFREYIAQLIEYDKKFLVIGNKNAITCKEIFNLIKDNKLWLGYYFPKEFRTPNNGKIEITKKLVGLTRWFTNLSHSKQNEEIICYKIYKGNEKDYPKYDEYDVIEVSKVTNIPSDYQLLMGVPVTFLDNYNPNQFEILGMDDHRLLYPKWRGRGPEINGKCVYRRIIIKRK